MALKYRLLLYSFLIIILIEALGSIASNEKLFDYAYLGFILCFVYFIMGFITTKQVDLKAGALNSVILGTFDVLVGWIISHQINTFYTNAPTRQFDFINYFFAGYTGVIFATFFGCLGSAFAYYKFKRNTSMKVDEKSIYKL